MFAVLAWFVFKDTSPNASMSRSQSIPSVRDLEPCGRWGQSGVAIQAPSGHAPRELSAEGGGEFIKNRLTGFDSNLEAPPAHRCCILSRTQSPEGRAASMCASASRTAFNTTIKWERPERRGQVNSSPRPASDTTASTCLDSFSVFANVRPRSVSSLFPRLR